MPEDQPENTPSVKPDDENMPEDQPEKSVHKGKSMPKVDGHIKRDVSFLQKKLAELEIAVSEVQENVQKIDLSELEGFKQRMEDIEDLTMVENAAVIELKKMLEETKPGQQDASPQLEEKIGSLEQKIDSISIPNAEDIKSSVLSSLPATADTSKMEQAMDAVKTSIETLKSDLESKISLVEQKASSVQTVSQPDAEGLKEDVKNYVLAKLPDYEWIKNELHSFKSYLDAEKIKLETLTNRMEKESQLPLPERAVDELEKIRNDWMVNIAKIDAVEKFVENFSNEMNQLKPIIKKLETFEKLMDLQTEITEKLETFKEYRDHIEKVMAENEETEKRIQREVSKIKNTEKMFTQIDDSMAVLSRELERNKHEVNEIITPLEEKLENFISITREDMSVFQGNLMVLEQGKA
ncbi:MAG: hypothetical protein HYS62_03225, partial [Candidatus Aenigmarchaeota archaeon]|nr:hypothetical protein [Candidatus Aenigmarchaeota archaeon]